MVRKTLMVLNGQWVRAAVGLFAALCLLLVLPGQASAKNPTLTITVGNPEFSADQINPGQSTTANFEVTPFAGTADSEGKTPKINSESFEVAVDSQTTIGAISVSAPGAVVNVGTSTPTSVSFDITGTVPTATFTTSIVVQASQNAATGPHPVTLAGTSIDTSDGSGSGNSATEDFQIEKLAVDISGPPYVIIDNNPADRNDFHPYGLPVTSQYTARATGGSGNYSWNWSVSSNIYNDGYPTDNPITVFGTGPGGPGEITCAATDTTTGSTQNGYRHPTVQDEYVVTETSGPTQVPEGKYIGVFGGSTNNLKTPINWTALAGQTFKSTVGDSVGFTTSIPAPISDIADIDFGFSANKTTTDSYSYTFNQGYSVSIPPGGQVTVVGYVYHTDYAGTYQIWGTSGVLQHGDWTYDEPAVGVGGLVPVDVVLQ